MVLFTVDSNKSSLSGDKMTVLLSKATTILGEAIENSLRSGDIASRCSELQYIALLPNCPEEMVDMVARRIIDTYEKEVCKKNLFIKFKNNGIHINFAIKDIASKGVLV
jgi:GGDEF domain-containing protein